MNVVGKKDHELFVGDFKQSCRKGEKNMTSLNFEAQSPSDCSSELTLSFYSAEVIRLAAHFRSSSVNGLNEDLAASLLQRHGPNIIEPTKESPLWVKFLQCYCEYFSILLLTAAALMLINYAMGQLRFIPSYYLITSMLLIFAIVVTAVCVFCQEYQIATTLDEFKQSVNPRKCWVVRENRTREILSAAVVVGDLVVLYPGSKVPADIRLISSLGMKIDKSLFTGESRSVNVSAEASSDGLKVVEANNTVFMGTSLVEGSGTGIVIATGKTTQIGRIIHRSNTRKLKHLVVQTEFTRATAIISSFAIALVIALIFYWAFYYRFKLLRQWRTPTLLLNIAALLISVVPIGLSVVVAVGLAITIRRLRSEHHVLSKHMGGIVTLGAATMLMVDKTGTLTHNIITVTRVICADLTVTNEESKIEGRDTKELDDILIIAASTPSRILEASCIITLLCNKEQLISLNELQAEIIRRALQAGQLQVSVPSEANKHSLPYALWNWAEKHINIANTYSTYHIHVTIRDKTSATVVSTDEVTGETYVFISGHVERVLPLCVSFLDADGDELPLSARIRTQMMDAVNAEARTGKNTIILSQVGPLSKDQFPTDFEYRTDPHTNFPITNLTLVSCLVLSDPTKEGARETMQQVQSAGMAVVVITGDSENSALSTAREVGLVTGAVHTLNSLHCGLGAALHAPNETITLNGNILERMSPVEWQYIFAHKTVIFARTEVEQKELIAKRYQGSGHIVAVTGCGINDCPALQLADVGIAVSSATEIARGVSDIVLLDGDIEGIIHGVRTGRLKYANLLKVIAFSLSGGCWPILLATAAFFVLDIPQVILILHGTFIGCTVDVYCGLALMCEPTERALTTKPPRSMRNISLINFSILSYSYMFYGNLIAIGCFVNYFLCMASRGPTSVLIGDTIPADFDTDQLPLGYRLNQLLFAWKFGTDVHTPYGQDQLDAWIEASNVYFLTIVLAQLGQVLSVRHLKPYFFDTIMHEGRFMDECRVQWPIVYAWIASLVTVVVFLYTPVLNTNCLTVPLAPKWWGLAIAWSVLWFVVAEIRKWLMALYPDSWFARWAWGA